jgi:hypothetical protein
MTQASKTLHLKFHGRIIDSLGIQMYQSPVAALAELIANAWDADATEVEVSVPDTLDEYATITVRDNGIGMTFDECQALYLNVGRNRRVDEHTSRTRGGRPCLGRKGLGKFAGFGIADIVEVATVSEATGEHTKFRLDLNELRSASFVSTEGKPIDVVEALGPDEGARERHGTAIRLLSLKLSQRRTAEVLARQMARRFLIAQQSSPFKVTINGVALPQDAEVIATEFEFPRDYRDDERPETLQEVDGWAREPLSDGNVVRWRIRFTPTPIGVEEFRGVSVFCGIKVAQTPFYFQLSGGLGGQHGQQYMTGLVQADYLDQGARDVITTERQRINWEDPSAAPLLEWGQARLKSLLLLWQKRRAEKKVQTINDRMASFSERLDRLKPSEAKTVKRALTKIASIDAIDQPQFEQLAHAILTAWEAGRLRQIIEDVARMDDMNAAVLMSVLAEHQVLSALHVAEVVKLKVDVIHGLRHRIETRDLETAIRDYIARYPWLISPRWETFQVERRIGKLVQDALQTAGIAADIDWEGRVDLTLSSGHELLVLEFMRPGLTVDRNHIDRFQHYIDVLRSRIRANSSLQLTLVTGMLVADNLDRKPENANAIERMKQDGMLCTEWRVLLPEAEAQWNQFLEILVDRAPDDSRVRALKEHGSTNAEDEQGALAVAPNPD